MGMVAFCVDFLDGGANFFFFCKCFTESDRGQVRRSIGEAEVSWVFGLLVGCEKDEYRHATLEQCCIICLCATSVAYCNNNVACVANRAVYAYCRSDCNLLVTKHTCSWSDRERRFSVLRFLTFYTS